MFKRMRWLSSLFFGAALAVHAADPLRLAPPRPDQPWPLPASSTSRQEVGGTGVRPIAGQTYSLAELIDLAQRVNPATRIAWEQARQAALAVGLAESAYAPQLTAEILAGYQTTPSPIPPSLLPRGYFTADTRELLPSLALKWLLFDFGGRAATAEAARAQSFVANVAFTGAHQKLIYAVSRDYYALQAARGRLRAEDAAVQSAETVEAAVAARRERGLATVVELAQARRQAAQARYKRERALADANSAYETLIDSVGIEPETKLTIAEDDGGSLPAVPAESVERLVEQALDDRPDIAAAYGRVRAAAAAVRAAQAHEGPEVALVGRLYQNVGDVQIDGGPRYSVNRPGGAIGAVFSLPLFDGGQRRARVAIARSELARAQDGVAEARSSAAHDVHGAYDALLASLAEYEAAQAVVDAAVTSADAALTAYQQGVGSYPVLASETASLAQARADQTHARAKALTAASALAFATGRLRQPPP